MNTENDLKEEFVAAEKTVQEIHNFYLILFVYVMMSVYLHWLDLRDGNYDWAYWPFIGFSISMVWFALAMLPLKFKYKMIRKEMKKNKKLVS